MRNLSNSQKTIKEILTVGVEEAAAQFFPDYQKMDELFLPSCTFAGFRKVQNNLELAWLGDFPE